MGFFRKDPPTTVTVTEPKVEREVPIALPVPEPEVVVVVSDEPDPVPRQAQPNPGGATANYRIAGVWMPDGSVSLLNEAHIQLEGHEQTYGVSDVMPLTRLEAAVLGKRYALSVV